MINIMSGACPRLRIPVVLAAVCLIGAVAIAESSPFGINAHIPSDDIADRIVEAGIEWVRIDFIWSRVETEPNVYDWSTYDELLDRLEARNLQTYATLQGTPAWATSGSEFSGVPDDVSQWQEFVYLAATRYRGRIAAWGIWNEPNLDHFWEGSREDYINELLKPASAAIRAADPLALVCGPELAHLSSARWDTWLREVILRAGDSLDVITHHYYPSFGKAWEVVWDLDEKPDVPWGSPPVRKVLLDSGWLGRPFWLTETGVQSQVEGPGDQADYYDHVIEDWFGPRPEGRWIEKVFFYQMRDARAPAPTTFGITHGKPDLIPKPAFYAYRNAIAATRIHDAEVLDIRAPDFVPLGGRAEISVILTNTGTSTWRGSSGFHVEAGLDSQTWKLDHEAIPSRFEVSSGDTVELLIPLHAPTHTEVSTSVPVLLSARLVADDGRRFGDPIRVTVTATDFAPPTIIRQPQSTWVPAGRDLTLSFAAVSDSPTSYQWRRNSVELGDGDAFTGSRSPEITIHAVDGSLEGDYDCVISNAAGSVVTARATVAVGAPRPLRSSGRSRAAISGNQTTVAQSSPPSPIQFE